MLGLVEVGGLDGIVVRGFLSVMVDRAHATFSESVCRFWE